MNVHDPEYYKQKKKHAKEKWRKEQLTKEFKQMLKNKKIEKYEPFGKYKEFYEISQDCNRLLEHNEAIKLSKKHHKQKKKSQIKKVKQFNKISYYVVYTE